MAGLNIVGVASGSPLSQKAMTSIAATHRLAAIVVPSTLRPTGLRRWFGPENRLADIRAPLISVEEIAQYAPDLIVVASYPARIPSVALAAARLGGLNIHMSLLPRHRGSDPIFWTYFDDDPMAGVTVHWMNTEIDLGDIAAQQQIELERGRPSRDLYHELADKGVALLSDALNCIAQGSASRRQQTVEGASYETARQIEATRVPFGQWSAERVWHVLSGLGDQRSGLIDSADGHRLSHGRATSFEMTAGITPGNLERTSDGYRLHCADGFVSVCKRD